jgi:hypothetical protein
MPRGPDHSAVTAAVRLAVVGDKERLACAVTLTITIAMSIASVSVNGVRARHPPVSYLVSANLSVEPRAMPATPTQQLVWSEPCCHWQHAKTLHLAIPRLKIVDDSFAQQLVSATDD